MSVSPIAVEAVRQVFFIPAQEIEGGGENVEGEIAPAAVNSFADRCFKALDLLRLNSGCIHQPCRPDPELAIADAAVTVINFGAFLIPECEGIIGDGPGFAGNFPAEKIQNVSKARC